MVTIKEVAEKAGVSVATVSRVINNSGVVSERTKLKVLRVMKELGYNPRPWAKYLASSRNRFTAYVVMTPRIRRFLDKRRGFYFDIFMGIETIAKQSGVLLKVVDPGYFEKADGFLLVGADFDKDNIEAYKGTGKPVVLVDHYIPDIRIDAVVSDGYGGAYAVVKMFIDRGYRRIVHIHGNLKPYSFRERYSGYTNAMIDHNLMPVYFEFDDFHDNMNSVVALMLRNYDLPEAIFTSNDFSAVRVIEELENRGIKVPDDVSVVGFDDSIEAEERGITTVRVYKLELGSFAMRRLLTLMMGQDIHPAKISLFTKIVERKTVK